MGYRDDGKLVFNVRQRGQVYSSAVRALDEHDAAHVYARNLWKGYRGEHAAVEIRGEIYYIDWSKVNG